MDEQDFQTAAASEELDALADGEPVREFEGSLDEGYYGSVEAYLSSIYYLPESWQIRRKPKTIRIGECDVPEPCRGPLQRAQTYYTPNLRYPEQPSPYVWGGGNPHRC